jgi:transmembrane sensor
MNTKKLFRTDIDAPPHTDTRIDNSPNDHQVAQAINWLIKFESGQNTITEQQLFQQWLKAEPLHEIAWQRLGQASQRFSHHLHRNITSSQALYSLNTADKQLKAKRRTLNTLSGVGVFALSAWFTRDYTGVGQTGRYVYGRMLSDLSTDVGEQKTLRLANGSMLTLNTQSAMDIDFNTQPPLVLHYGELAIKNSQGEKLRASNNVFSPKVGSEFTLFKQYDLCRLEVVTGHVNCTLANGENYKIAAGQGLMRQGRTTRKFKGGANTLSWRQGLITAQRTPLGDFIKELSRYKSGYLHCDNSIAALTLSGSFPIADTSAILDNLCQILPIRQQRIGRFWVRLLSA